MSSFWDSRFGVDEYVYGTEPNAFLVAQAGGLVPGGRVLVPGDGEGRNGVWLAGRGMAVHSVDSSRAGLAKIERLARERKVAVETEWADLLAWDWPKGAYDAVASIFLHFPSAERPRIHAAMLDALKPGGLIVLDGFRPEQLGYDSGGPKDADLLVSTADLAKDFEAADILLLEECQAELDEGPFHRGPAAIVRMVARRR